MDHGHGDEDGPSGGDGSWLEGVERAEPVDPVPSVGVELAVLEIRGRCPRACWSMPSLPPWLPLAPSILWPKRGKQKKAELTTQGLILGGCVQRPKGSFTAIPPSKGREKPPNK